MQGKIKKYKKEGCASSQTHTHQMLQLGLDMEGHDTDPRTHLLKITCIGSLTKADS